MKPIPPHLPLLWFGICGRRDEAEARAFNVTFSDADHEVLERALKELVQTERDDKFPPRVTDLRSVYSRLIATQNSRFSPPGPRVPPDTPEQRAAFAKAGREAVARGAALAEARRKARSNNQYGDGHGA